MTDFVMPLMLGLDISSLTMSLVNIASPSGAESALADSVEAALHTVAHLDVDRVGDSVIARSGAGRGERVVVAGRLDSAAVDADPLAYVEMGKLYGPGACSAKGALAITLKAAAAGGYPRDVTFVLRAGDWSWDGSDALRGADFLLLAEPTDTAVLGGALDHPLAQHLIGITGVDPATDAGDVLGLASRAVPTAAFGPGDPTVASGPDEFVPTAQLTQSEFVLRQWLTT